MKTIHVNTPEGLSFDVLVPAAALATRMKEIAEETEGTVSIAK